MPALIPRAMRRLLGAATLVLSPLAQADWTLDLESPVTAASCSGIAEPFIYYASTCEYVTMPSNLALNRADLWSDLQIHAAVRRSGSMCAVTYSNYLWIDEHVYPIAANATVLHHRAYLGLFDLALSGCSRPNGQPLVPGQQRLLLSNFSLGITGTGTWYFDRAVARAYLRVTSTTGDVVCTNAQPAPAFFDDIIYSNGLE